MGIWAQIELTGQERRRLQGKIDRFFTHQREMLNNHWQSMAGIQEEISAFIEKARQVGQPIHENRRRTAAEQIYEHHECAHGSTHSEVYWRLGIPEPTSKNSPRKEPVAHGSATLDENNARGIIAEIQNRIDRIEARQGGEDEGVQETRDYQLAEALAHIAQQLDRIERRQREEEEEVRAENDDG